MNHNVNVTFGGFIPMLTVAFVVLKLCGQINWSWIWVLSPIWICAAIALACGVIYVLLGLLESR